MKYSEYLQKMMCTNGILFKNNGYNVFSFDEPTIGRSFQMIVDVGDDFVVVRDIEENSGAILDHETIIPLNLFVVVGFI